MKILRLYFLLSASCLASYPAAESGSSAPIESSQQALGDCVPSESSPEESALALSEIHSETLPQGSEDVVDRFANLPALCEELITEDGCQRRNQMLNLDIKHREVAACVPGWLSFMMSLSFEERAAIKGVAAADQAHALFGPAYDQTIDPDRLRAVLPFLLSIDTAYWPLGGIAGYQNAVLSVLRNDSDEQEFILEYPPQLRLKSESTGQALNRLSEVAEIYVVGGSADRLDLCDKLSGQPLPGACLIFCGHTLLEGMIRDLQAREYLFWKLSGRQDTVPIVIMTSETKQNHAKICDILEAANYFGRPKDSFLLVTQPSVPVVTVDGDWCHREQAELTLKPGGHGALWSVLEVENGFEWLSERGVSWALIRQVNNPLLGLDDTLLGFYGTGLEGPRAFGFLGCERSPGEAMGVLALAKHTGVASEEAATICVEYTDFLRHDIDENSEMVFPGNINLLFADLATIRPILQRNPFPRCVLNLKHEFRTLNRQGEEVTIRAGRLESLVQGVAECLWDPVASDTSRQWMAERLRTFVAVGDRSKTFSPIKRKIAPDGSLDYTAVKAFYDLQREYHRLLTEHCHFEMPLFPTQDAYTLSGLPCLFQFHPALGPLYAVISQKLRNSRLAEGSSLLLEVAEVDIESLDLDGALEIIADAPMGISDGSNLLDFSDTCGRCRLKNVVIRNPGLGERLKEIDTLYTCDFGSHPSLKIVLEGSSEFSAENVTFDQPTIIRVPDGVHATARMDGNRILYEVQPLSGPSWRWQYLEEDGSTIELIQVD